MLITSNPERKVTYNEVFPLIKVYEPLPRDLARLSSKLKVFFLHSTSFYTKHKVVNKF